MRYAGIIKNDISAAPGVCLTFFTQGCPFHCIGCHNPETWDFDGGREFTAEVLDDIIYSLKANNVNRTLCIMGGEPLCEQNLEIVSCVITHVKEVYPDIKIYIWTGYTMEELDHRVDEEELKEILYFTDCIIDGRFIFEKRDTTLPMRGSSNQRIIYLKEGDELANQN